MTLAWFQSEVNLHVSTDLPKMNVRITEVISTCFVSLFTSNKIWSCSFVGVYAFVTIVCSLLNYVLVVNVVLSLVFHLFSELNVYMYFNYLLVIFEVPDKFVYQVLSIIKIPNRCFHYFVYMRLAFWDACMFF